MFSAEWLALREPVDHEARSLRLARFVARAVSAGNGTSVLDLACGTGSNLRYLYHHLGRPQRWLLVDYDPALLERAARDGRFVNELDTRCLDLNDLRDDLFEARTLVTASALLDLVSESWVRRLATRCAAHHAAVLFALTYDGRSECDPAEPEDELVRDLTTRHQHLDQGFGPGLGPDAIAAAADALSAQGYDIHRDRSDWVIEPDRGALQRELVNGWAEAAIQMAPASESAIRDWQRRRLAYVDERASRIVVGHEDLAAVPSA